MNVQHRILIVDDDPDVIEQLTAVLSAAGFDVTSAGGRAEAEEILMTLHPDLVIVDLIMEEHDAGFVLCHEAKRLYPGTPVIMLTSVKAATGMSFAPGTAEQHAWMKADLLLDKPLRPEQIRSVVQRLLAVRQRLEATV